MMGNGGHEAQRARVAEAHAIEVLSPVAEEMVAAVECAEAVAVKCGLECDLRAYGALLI
jgi:hypothetical protein